jgi:hypothetical protein
MPIPGYEGFYEASDLGRVRSLPHRVKTAVTPSGWRISPGRVLRATQLPGNRHLVTLTREGRRRSWFVHQLVALAFIGPYPPGMQVRHGTAGRGDDRLANLCYGTPAENVADQVRDGTRAIIAGELHHHSKLTLQIIAECRVLHEAGESYSALGRRFGVSRTTISAALRGINWKAAHD